LRYYGANATKHSAGSLLNFRDAQSRNYIETGRLHVGASVEAVVKMLQPGFNVAGIAAIRDIAATSWADASDSPSFPFGEAMP
jgi:hypothetical protein